MKALVLYGAKDYRVEYDWKEPMPEPGWALIKVAYAGICGSDLPRFFRTGSYHSPMIIGHEFSGVVAQRAEGGEIPEGTPVAVLPIIPCGKCHGCMKTGEAFHCANYQFIGSRNDGGFAEYCAVKEDNLFVLDSNEQLLTGAMIELFAVGLHVVRRSGFSNGSAIVFGAGPIGISCALWLQYFGADVTVVDVRDYSLQVAASAGIKKACRFDDIGEKVFDYAYEASGAAAAIRKAVDTLEHKGSITVVGRNQEDTIFPARTFETLMRKEIALNGCWGYNMNGEEELMRKFIAAFPVQNMISHVIPLEKSIDMLEQMNNKSCDYCKVLIDMEMKK